MPSPQTYPNHKKYVFGYHFVLSALIAILLVWAIIGFARYPAVANFMPIVNVLALGLLFWYARAFAMGVQDRLIRLEEQLRLARVLPDDLKPRIGDIRVGQLVALRFAPDAEVSELVRRVLAHELGSADAIKRAIVNWRADHVRA